MMGWAEPLLMSQSCTQPVLCAVKVSTDQGQERAEHRKGISYAFALQVQFSRAVVLPGMPAGSWMMQGGKTFPTELVIQQTPCIFGCPHYSHEDTAIGG